VRPGVRIQGAAFVRSKVHHLVYAASLDTAAHLRERLGAIGNLASDGRPILGLDSRHLLEITLESGADACLVPAHVWWRRCSVPALTPRPPLPAAHPDPRERGSR
jgi:PHP family Zn ribbon phosphoesterase